MRFYDGFLNVNKSPAQKWRDNLQDIVDKQFENASTFWDDIYEEVNFGTDRLEEIVKSPENSCELRRISARITTLIDAKSGQRVNDDFRKIIFNKNDYQPRYGQRYYFDNNIWMIYSTNNIREDSSSAYIRRCNNTINVRNSDGSIHREPCYIDYKMTETQIAVGQNVDVPSGRIEVVCQTNKYTRNFKINTRFILNNTVYRIRQFIDYNNTETFSDASNYVMKFYADWVLLDHNDNLEDRIADDRHEAHSDVADIIVPLNETKTIELDLNKNYSFNIDKSTKVSSSYYVFKHDKNKFSITNLRQNKHPVIVDYLSDDGSDIGKYSIYLGGVV